MFFFKISNFYLKLEHEEEEEEEKKQPVQSTKSKSKKLVDLPANPGNLEEYM